MDVILFCLSHKRDRESEQIISLWKAKLFNVSARAIFSYYSVHQQVEKQHTYCYMYIYFITFLQYYCKYIQTYLIQQCSYMQQFIHSLCCATPIRVCAVKCVGIVLLYCVCKCDKCSGCIGCALGLNWPNWIERQSRLGKDQAAVAKPSQITPEFDLSVV